MLTKLYQNLAYIPLPLDMGLKVGLGGSPHFLAFLIKEN